MNCPKCKLNTLSLKRWPENGEDFFVAACSECYGQVKIHFLTPARIEAVKLIECFTKIMEVLDESLESFEQTIQTPASPLTLSEQYHIRNTLKSYIKIQEDAFAEVPK